MLSIHSPAREDIFTDDEIHDIINVEHPLNIKTHYSVYTNPFKCKINLDKTIVLWSGHCLFPDQHPGYTVEKRFMSAIASHGYHFLGMIINSRHDSYMAFEVLISKQIVPTMYILGDIGTADEPIRKLITSLELPEYNIDENAVTDNGGELTTDDGYYVKRMMPNHFKDHAGDIFWEFPSCQPPTVLVDRNARKTYTVMKQDIIVAKKKQQEFYIRPLEDKSKFFPNGINDILTLYRGLFSEYFDKQYSFIQLEDLEYNCGYYFHNGYILFDDGDGGFGAVGYHGSISIKVSAHIMFGTKDNIGDVYPQFCKWIDRHRPKVKIDQNDREIIDRAIELFIKHIPRSRKTLVDVIKRYDLDKSILDKYDAAPIQEIQFHDGGMEYEIEKINWKEGYNTKTQHCKHLE